MRRRIHLRHLVTRFLGSLSNAAPPEADVAWARAQLLTGEFDLWCRMSHADQRHSVAVARCVAASGPGVNRDEVAGALLHDVGKIDSALGTFSRVVATIVGPRTDRLRRYHDHERIGAQMAVVAGSADSTVELIQGRGPSAATLRACDNADPAGVTRGRRAASPGESGA